MQEHDEREIRERVWAKLDAERPWWVLHFYEVGLVVRVRGKTLGDALVRLGRSGKCATPCRILVGITPPGRFSYHSEPFGH